MKSFLAFTAAIADPIRLRLICLALAHKITPTEVASVLKLAPAETANQLKVLTDAGLLKADGKKGFVQVRGRHLKLLKGLFDQLGVAAKSDTQLKADAKAAKQLREARRHAEKEAKKHTKSKAKPSQSKTPATRQKGKKRLQSRKR